MTFKPRTRARTPAPGRQATAPGEAPAAGLPRYLRAGRARDWRDAGGASMPDATPLPVSAPGDASELEADAAARVLAGESAAGGGRGAAGARPLLQPQPHAGSGAGGAHPAATSRTGEALPDGLAARYGARLGHDLSGVRVHADGSAAVAAREAGARAFTIGADIVFGSGEYAPGTAHGDRLIAHEVAHVVQQAHSGRTALMRQPAPGAPGATGLDALSAPARRSLKVDTAGAHGATGNLRNFFGAAGTFVTADNVDVDHDLVTPAIDALPDAKVRSALWKGLRAYAQSVFDLLPDDKGVATTTRLNLVHHANLDLSPWGGPDAAFRFTAIGSTTAGKIKVKVLIEQLGAPFVPMSASAAGVEAAKARPTALARNSLLPDVIWQRVLRALDRIPAATLARIHDVEFDMSSDARGADGEAASYLAVWDGSKWTRRIVLYADVLRDSDEQFAFVLIHEVGHALDLAPTEGAKGPVADKEAHADQAFKDAAQKDGGRAKAITAYGAKSDKEFYAECFAMYTQHPATLKTLRPDIHAYFAAVAAPAVKAPAGP